MRDDHRISASPERRLANLGLVLPTPRAPIGAFVPARREGALLFLSGQGPVTPGGVRSTGRVGAQTTIDRARRDARLTTVNLLGVLRHELGSLDRVRRVVRVLGMVNADPAFARHDAVMRGCSDLLLSVFGPIAGRPAGTLLGNASLPNHISVEIEMIVSIEEENRHVADHG